MIARTAVLLLFLLLALTSGGAARELKNFTLGVNTHRVYAEEAQLMASLRQASRRVDLLWQEIADHRGVVRPDHRTIRRIQQLPVTSEEPVVILDYGHAAWENGGRPVSTAGIEAYGHYAAAVSQAFGGRTRYFEVWNEWNAARVPDGSPGTVKAKAYVALLQEAYAAIKRQRPSSVVLGGALSGNGLADNWLPDACRSGLLDHCDGLSFHPYFYRGSGDDRLPEIGLLNAVNAVRAELAKYPKGAAMPLYLTELGWPTLAGNIGVTEAEQAKFLARSVLLLAAEPRVRGVWVYELRDGGDDPAEKEEHFGLSLPNRKPKPAFAVMRDLKLLLSRARAVEDVTNDFRESLRILKFSLRDGSQAWVCWTLRPDEHFQVGFKFGARESPAVRLLGEPVTSFSASTWNQVAGSGAITVGDVPVLISGRIHGGALLVTRRVASQ